ncbi:MAG: Tex family protein [Bacteroidales bacterium]|nr:Tex family protein [Bacteroidales bacterium]MDZ4203696.1 Tex family protein [Bacteroidales bacterium]
MELKYAATIARELSLEMNAVESTIRLLSSGATIPFIARYRKEWTGGLDEVKLAAIRDRAIALEEINKRRQTVLETIREQGKLTQELEKQILEAVTLAEIEDLYLPYRPKRKTRASVAIARGLEPLAKMIMAQRDGDIFRLAQQYVDPAKEVNNVEEALAGARDIMAEWINESAFARQRVRLLFTREGVIHSRVIKDKETEGAKYRDYFAWDELARRAPSHRLLAMFRGENEKMLRIYISPPEEKAIVLLNKIFIKAKNDASIQVASAIRDSYKRLLQPSMETEIRNLLKEKADTAAIRIFADNLRQLLLAPPLGQKRVLAIDPGYRSGCKVVCLDAQGNLLYNETIYPHPPQSEVGQAIKKIVNLVNAHKIEAISIGNGTASRETENFIRRVRFDRDLTVVVVNESGASVYSASALAREEFPDYDVTVRGAVSIGRRLMDPLSELVKIDPKSIGVGQYQHDVDQKELMKSLEGVVESCVNQVGVDVNTASKELLTYISGVGPALATAIVDYRAKNGAFSSRNELIKVPRFGEKAFEQAAGFLRIRDGINPLDVSAVHPESYYIVDRMAQALGISVGELIEDKTQRQKIDPTQFIDEKAGLPTLLDIIRELEKPGRDPRKNFDYFSFDPDIHEIDDLKPGMIISGIVTNITAFGAFIDVGVHQDGLVHVSQLANRFVSDPAEIVKIYQKVKVKVLEVDIERRRIQFSMKEVPQ